MYNLKTNYDKISPLVKSVLIDFLFQEGIFKANKKYSEWSDIEVVKLFNLIDTNSLDSENWMFSEFKDDLLLIFPEWIDCPNYNRRKRRLNGCRNAISEWVAHQIDEENKKVISDPNQLQNWIHPRFLRSKICKEVSQIQPSTSFNPSLNIHYCGFKMQLMISQKCEPFSARSNQPLFMM